MKVVELRDLRRKETPLHYIREYSGTAVLERAGVRIEQAIVFTIERRPLGSPEVSARFLEDPEWPLLPLLRGVRDLAVKLDKEGRLP